MSYWYLRNMKRDVAAVLQVMGKPEHMIMDSGLFSLMFGAEKGTIPSTYEAYRDYTLRYLDDVDRWGFPCTIVESDTHKLLGMEATFRLRELFAPLGDRVIYVWHQPEGLDGLLRLAEERSYIALSVPELRILAANGKATSRNQVSAMVTNLLRRVHRHCEAKGILPPRIHLLGCTVQSMMETPLAYTCDSTSWLAGVRFGTGMTWNTKTERLQQVHLRSERFKAWRKLCAEQNPDAAGYAKQQGDAEYYLNTLACAAAFAEYQRWLDARYTAVPMRGVGETT